MKGFHMSFSFGTFCCAVLVAVLNQQVSSQQNKARISSQNETILDDIHATGEIMKKVGEFASRTLWVKKGKIIFPTGTILTLAPQITIPAFRRKAFKGGLNSDIQASMYFYINCDKLGYTHDLHPFPFDRPPFYPFGSLMRPIEGGESDKLKEEEDKMKEKTKEKLMNEVSQSRPTVILKGPTFPANPYFYQTVPGTEQVDSYKTYNNNNFIYTHNNPIHKRSGNVAQQQHVIGQGARRNIRKPRSIMSLPPPDKLPGGERAVLLPSIENMMSDFGFEGRGCMLRAICEIHEFPLQEGYGLFGEMIALFFSISQSPYAETHMPQYLKAEEAGRTGDCSAYKQICAKSLFKWQVEKKKNDDEDIENNDIPSSPFRSKLEGREL